VTVALQAGERHQAQQIADMEARRSRIEADVRRHAFVREHVGQPIGRVVHEAAPGQLVKERHHGVFVLL
jgi:hypothetical protein